MNKLPILSTVSFVFVLFSSVINIQAAEDSTDIDINVSFADFVKFTGTAVGASKYYTVDDIKPVGSRRRGPRVTLGTLGLESNLTGDCIVDFSTQNNFRLRHTISNQRLTRYRLRYKRKNITRTRNRQITLPCNVNASKIKFQAVGNFRNNPQVGVYQDIVTVTVTTQ